jgi:hypothetical protein
MEGNKNKHIFSKYCMLPVAGITVFFIITVLFAAPAKAITISQLNVEIVVRPGETIEQLVQLYDESFTGVTVYPVVYNFTASPNSEGSALILTDPEDLKPDRAWVKWSKEEITAANTDESDEVVEAETDEDAEEETELGYGQEDVPLKLPVEGTLYDFPYRIEVPQGAEPGTHLISLVFQLRPAEQTITEGAAVYIGSNVATNIFVKVLGATIDDIDVEFKSGVFAKKGPDVTVAERKESFLPKSFFLKPPVDFLVTISNKGNTHQKPDGNIKIVNDLWGSRTEEIQVNEVNKIILPGTDRTFEVESYGQGFMFGKYRAKITLLYGDPLKPVQKEIAFWIVPLVEILIALGIILLIIIIIIVIRKFRKKGKAKKELEREEKLRQQIIEELKGKKLTPDEKDQSKVKFSPGQENKQKSKKKQKNKKK